MTIVKTVLIGAFVQKDSILTYFEFLKKKFKIGFDRVYVYEIEGNDDEYIATFATKDRSKYVGKIRKSIILHTKNGSLFSINALNKLIESEGNGQEAENYKIDWEKYRNKLILVVNGDLKVSNIARIEDKTAFLS